VVERLRRGWHTGVHHVSCFEGPGVMICLIPVLTVNDRIYEATREAQNDCGRKCQTGGACLELKVDPRGLKKLNISGSRLVLLEVLHRSTFATAVVMHLAAGFKRCHTRTATTVRRCRSQIHHERKLHWTRGRAFASLTLRLVVIC
jgi:hypothetical protein